MGMGPDPLAAMAAAFTWPLRSSRLMVLLETRSGSGSSHGATAAAASVALAEWVQDVFAARSLPEITLLLPPSPHPSFHTCSADQVVKGWGSCFCFLAASFPRLSRQLMGVPGSGWKSVLAGGALVLGLPADTT